MCCIPLFVFLALYFWDFYPFLTRESHGCHARDNVIVIFISVCIRKSIHIYIYNRTFDYTLWHFISLFNSQVESHIELHFHTYVSTLSITICLTCEITRLRYSDSRFHSRPQLAHVNLTLKHKLSHIFKHTSRHFQSQFVSHVESSHVYKVAKTHRIP